MSQVNFSGSKLSIMSLAIIYTEGMLKHSKPFALIFNSKKPSVSKIVLVISTYIGCLPKLFPNVCALICFPVVLPLCYHSGIKILNEKELGILSLKGGKSPFFIMFKFCPCHFQPLI